MNENKILCVAIPTYKRPEFLDKCIESIFSSCGNVDVQVLVMDDSLGEGNAWVYDKYKSAKKNIRVIYNKKNLGIDANICACIENADSDYVWLMGEDDLMRKSSIPTALAMIKDCAPVPFVYANYSYITADQKKQFRERSIEIEEGLQPFKIFFEKNLWSAGFIGGCIIKKESFLATRYRDFIGTYYAHVAGICLSSIGMQVAVIAQPQVGNRVGDASTFTWSEDSYGVFQGWRRLLSMLEPDFGTDSYARARASHIQAHGYLGYKFLIGKKADGLLQKTDITALLTGEISRSEKLRIILVSNFAPRFICRLLRSTYSKIRGLKLTYFHLS